jgi:hypothetical protein
MKNLISAAVWGALLLNAALASEPAHPVVNGAQVPNTEAARQSADLIVRAELALHGFAAACAKGEAQALNRVTTSDVRLEYALDEPGTFLSIDAGSVSASCGELLDGEFSNVWILPTHDDSSVFVQYETAGGRHLALVEMRGDRIARMVSFTSATPVLLARLMPGS